MAVVDDETGSESVARSDSSSSKAVWPGGGKYGNRSMTTRTPVGWDDDPTMSARAFAPKALRPWLVGSTVTGPPNAFGTCLVVRYLHGFAGSSFESLRRVAAPTMLKPATVDTATPTASARHPHLTGREPTERLRDRDVGPPDRAGAPREPHG